MSTGILEVVGKIVNTSLVGCDVRLVMSVKGSSSRSVSLVDPIMLNELHLSVFKREQKPTLVSDF